MTAKPATWKLTAQLANGNTETIYVDEKARDVAFYHWKDQRTPIRGLGFHVITGRTRPDDAETFLAVQVSECIAIKAEPFDNPDAKHQR